MRSLRCEIPAYRAAAAATILCGMAEDGKAPHPNPSGDPAAAAAAPSMEDLARRIMDLWQEQMAAIAADPDLMRQMAQMMAASPFPAMMQGIVQGMLAATASHPGAASPFTPPNPYAWWKTDHGAKIERGAAPVGPAPAAPASQPGGGDLAELRRNLAGLEARLRELQSAGGRGEPAKSESGPQGSKPRKRAPRKPAPKVGGAGTGDGGSGSGGAGGGAAG